MLNELKQLHKYILEQESDTSPMVSRSSYNLIYGLSLGLLLYRKKLINKPTSPLNLLEQVESFDSSFFEIDLVSYNLDDQTKQYCDKYGKHIAKKLTKLNSSDWWKCQEDFFISSF